MRITRHIEALFLGAFLALCGAGAHAAMGAPPTVSATDASAAPGAIATPTLTFDFGAVNYPFSTLSFEMGYVTSQLTFLPDQSTVTVGATSGSYNSFLAALDLASGGGLIVNDGAPGFYGVTAATLPETSFAVTGQVTISAAFRLAAPFSSPQQIQYSGLISGPSDGLGGNIETPFGGTITISAVPEPEIWLMWLAGVGLLATRAARRRS